ncbi:Putative outermembrane protein exposed to the bacterial surface [Acinetobacter baumannii]|nr:Putative outermembrane protein exposed to the bacterial surface [Acinetobacter baumannii]
MKNNGNTGSTLGTVGSSGNGTGDGLLNGAASGNGEHNYGIGNGNGNDTNFTFPFTGVLNFSGNALSGFGSSTSHSLNIAPTTTTNTVNDNDTIVNSNSGGLGSSGNGSGDGLLNGAASGNGEHNYGIGNGNGEGTNFTLPFTGGLNILGNAWSGIGGTSAQSINISPTNASNTVNDNDTTHNGNASGGVIGSGGSGNGSGDGLLNGISSGNGEHNYGIGNGNGDGADITAPITTPINILGNSSSLVGGEGTGDILSPITNVIGGIGGIGGDLGDNPLTGIIQSGIDVLQGAESLKTSLINGGIDTIAGTIIGAFPQAEHPVGDFADLGKLLFETSHDSVNGTLEAISDLAGADLNGAQNSISGVLNTLIANGSSASNIIQHIISDDFVAQHGDLFGPITNIIGGIDNGNGGFLGGLNDLINISYGGADNSQQVDVSGILGNILGSVGSNQGIAVGEPDPTGGSLIHTISLTTLNQLTDQLLHALPTV